MFMKYESNIKLLLITTVFLLVLIISYGTIKSINKSKTISESYQTEIVLNKNVMLDDQSIIDKYGEPILLEKGTRGTIRDTINWYGEKRDSNHIKAWVILNDGNKLDIVLDYEHGLESNNSVIIQSVDSSVITSNDTNTQSKTSCFDVITPVLNISSIEDYSIIITEFEEINELYSYRVKQTIIWGCIIATIIAAVIVSVIWIIKSIFHNDRVGKTLIVLSICFNIVMMFSIILELYFSGWY